MAATNPYLDLQVNGYGGVDFNQADLTAEGLHTACECLRRDGTSQFLATFVTEHVPQMCHSMRRLVELRKRDPLAVDMIVGIHIEGPFISPHDGYRGAHPKDAVRPAQVDAMKEMLDAADGLTRIVTLAPEFDDGLHVTRTLAKMGVVVSAGHCNPTLDQLNAAVDAGLGMFTHLGNGCPMQMHRHDNIIQRALSLSGQLTLCFIADGVHIPIAALRNYLMAADMTRCVVVTDAVAPAGRGPGRYTLGRWEVVIGDDMVAMAPDGSHFLGSAINMPRSVANLVDRVGLSAAQARRLITTNPRRAIGLDA